MDYRLYVDGSLEGTFEEIEEAETAAADIAADVDPHGYVVWVDWWVVATGRVAAKGTIRVDPPEPPCSGARHQWRAVIDAPAYDTCILCGAVRRITTDACRPSTGQRVEDLVEYPNLAALAGGERIAEAAEETAQRAAARIAEDED